jgi:hypothetical protein
LLARIAKLHSGQPILLSIGVNPLYLRFRGAGDFVQTRQCGGEVPGNRADRRRQHQPEQRRGGEGADQPMQVEAAPPKITSYRAGDEVVRELPYALR